MTYENERLVELMRLRLENKDLKEELQRVRDELLFERKN